VAGDLRGLGWIEGWLAPLDDTRFRGAYPVLLVEREDLSWWAFPVERFAFPPAAAILGLEDADVGFRGFVDLRGEEAEGLRFSLGYLNGDRFLRAGEVTEPKGG